MVSTAPSRHIFSFLPRFNHLFFSHRSAFVSPTLSTTSLVSRKCLGFLRWQNLRQGFVEMDRGSCCSNNMDAREASQRPIGRSDTEAETNLAFGAIVKESEHLIAASEAKSVDDSNTMCEAVEKIQFRYTNNTQESKVAEEEISCGLLEEGSPQITWKIQRWSAEVVNLHLAVENVQGPRGTPWFPYTDNFVLNNGRHLSSTTILDLLGPFLVDGRKQRIEKVVANRTYSVSLIVEGLDDLGNISAVFRSAEALGFQSVHVISKDTKKRYKKKRKVSVGAEKWLDVEIWDTTKKCVDALRARGYRIVSTNISADTVSILEMDWTVPTAVIFGNELKGISDEALFLSDMRCSIPMIGMVDSFNVSVAAGILMYHAVHDRIARTGKHGDLNICEQNILTAEFYLRHKSHAISVLDHLVTKRQCGQTGLSTSSLDVAISLAAS
ncbi:hypothetical protein O6H91_10G066600 [Diphasiastrum complanatum]|uniref:Uncharacterized protein n=1 Tax=Diphasiastrum complanatum TaxID=34168 RepID=A0ACC2CI26_DIPCM|nr:hypothetical protein O6H91_10G066600 [Diphasiastrum complanatum]